MATDGKYCSLVQLKQFLLGTRTDPNNPSVFNQQVINTPDDAILSDLILNAEAAFELMTGTGYDQVVYTNVAPFMSFIDGNGWMHMFARERGPVTAISAVQLMDIGFGASTTWQTVSWDAVNLQVLPPFSLSDTHPLPESWHVMIMPASPQIGPRGTGQVLVKWSYTGGFATIPQSLTALVARMSMYLYKLREMPAGKVVNQPLGTVTVPSNYPPDIIKQIKLWSPKYA